MTDWIRVCATSELLPGEKTVAWDGDTPILVFNHDGDYYALEDRCTHEDFELSSGPFDAAEAALLKDAVSDLMPYFEKEGGTAPALEFLSPIKGPALEQITVEVGSGIRSAADAAKLYDEDVKKQAKQLGLPNW